MQCSYFVSQKLRIRHPWRSNFTARPSGPLMPSCSPRQPDISSETIQKAIRTVAHEDSRSSNVMILGLPERVSEDLASAVGQVFNEMSEKIKLEATRIGSRKDNSIRPVKVQLLTGELS